ncbi:MAG: ABC transporter permease subunit [Candidatus Lokiarchaeota archaeon]|nr:ABC transporter permease subunit [Candidatus Lokiarchaeota archaeon]
MSETLVQVEEQGWRMGLGNLMRKEFRAWFATNDWWQNALLWTALASFFALPFLGDPPAAMFIFVIMSTIFTSIATIIITQEKILDEKRFGTAAWVLSKPVSRVSFILSKLIPNAVGLFFSMNLVPGIVLFIVFTLAGTPLPANTFFLGILAMGLWVIFLAFFTITLGTFFDEEGPVMAPGFVMLFIIFNLGPSAILGEFSPFGLWLTAAAFFGGTFEADTPSPDSWIYPYGVNMIATLGIIIILTLIAIWRFRKEEF